jgi:hypothetical protein
VAQEKSRRGGCGPGPNPNHTLDRVTTSRSISPKTKGLARGESVYWVTTVAPGVATTAPDYCLRFIANIIMGRRRLFEELLFVFLRSLIDDWIADSDCVTSELYEAPPVTVASVSSWMVCIMART